MSSVSVGSSGSLDFPLIIRAALQNTLFESHFFQYRKMWSSSFHFYSEFQAKLSNKSQRSLSIYTMCITHHGKCVKVVLLYTLINCYADARYTYARSGPMSNVFTKLSQGSLTLRLLGINWTLSKCSRFHFIEGERPLKLTQSICLIEC